MTNKFDPKPEQYRETQFGGNIDKIIIEANGQKIEFNGHDDLYVEIVSKDKATMVFKNYSCQSAKGSFEAPIKFMFSEYHGAMNRGIIDSSCLQLEFQNYTVYK